MDEPRPARGETHAAAGHLAAELVRLNVEARGSIPLMQEKTADLLAFLDSMGAVESGFPEWLELKRKKKLYLAYDPDESFTALEHRVARGERFPHSDAAIPLR